MKHRLKLICRKQASKEAPPETYTQKRGFPQKHRLKTRTLHTQRWTHFWRFILKSTPIKTLSLVRTSESSRRHLVSIAICQSLLLYYPYKRLPHEAPLDNFIANRLPSKAPLDYLINISTISQDWWWVHTASHIPNLTHPH